MQYNSGIEFCLDKKAKRVFISVGQVNCILREMRNSRITFYNSKSYSYQLLLESPEFNNVIDCMELICSAKCIIDSVIGIDKDSLISNLYIEEYKRLGRQCPIEFLGNAIKVSDPGDSWYLAILIAEKSINDIHSRIAVLKYYNARIIYDIHPMDLHPNSYNDLYFSLLDKLRFAYSIIDINSIVEELGIELRANAKNPSIINNAWNDKVHEDLKSRLKSVKVNPDKLIPWLSRQDNKRPFKSVINSSNLCSWSDNEQIFDFEISIKDAILELDYQRDKLASHCVGERVNDLNIIDLENAFCLLRIILLDYFEIDLNTHEEDDS